MLYIFYGRFLPLRKLLLVSYCNYCYCIVSTVLLRDWESLLFIVEAEWLMAKTIFGDPVGIGRDYACYAPNRTDCPWVSEDVKKHISYETYDSSYYLQNVWANERFCKKVNQLQLTMLIRVTYLLLRIQLFQERL